MLDTLDAVAVRQWCVAALDALRRQQCATDALNAYPVPNTDTGTNLVSTFTAAHESLSGTPVPDGGTAPGWALRTPEALATAAPIDGRQFAAGLVRSTSARPRAPAIAAPHATIRQLSVCWLRQVLPAHLSACWPLVETRMYDGGQPDQLLLVGVE